MNNQSLRLVSEKSWIGVMVIGLAIMPLNASAEMRTVSSSEISHLSEIERSGYVEYYEHPEIGSFPFKNIYIEPVVNAMPVREIYQTLFRPVHVDELTADFHASLLRAFESTGLLTDEPGEDTLVISTSIIFVSQYDERTTGTHLAEASINNRIRGNAAMEMTWRAGPGGEIVAALRDGRWPEQYAPVTDRNDRFTDVHDIFNVWAMELTMFFGGEPETATN